jgi:hypothetical protein
LILSLLAAHLVHLLLPIWLLAAFRRVDTSNKQWLVLPFHVRRRSSLRQRAAQPVLFTFLNLHSSCKQVTVRGAQ